MIKRLRPSAHSKKRVIRHDAVIGMPQHRILRRILSLCAALLLCLGATIPAARADGVYRLATGLPTGSFYPVGVALNTLMQLKQTEDDNVLLKVQSTRGPRSNLISLLEGEADIAFVDAATVLAAITKTPPFDRYENTGELQTLAILWPDVAHLILRRPQIVNGNIGDFRNLIGEAVSFGSRTSSSNYASAHLFKSMGIYDDNLFKLPSYDAYQSAEAFIDGRINALSLFTHVASQSIGQIFADPQTQAVFVEISDADIKKINDTETPLWHRYVIAEHTYPNQPLPVQTIAQTNFLIVRQNFDIDDAEHITKTLFQNLTFLRALHDAARQIEKDSSTEKLVVPFHPGALRYYEKQKECTGLSCVFN